MKRLIDKSDVIAEIDSLQDATMDENRNFLSSYHEGIFDGLSKIENFLDTIKTKEIDLEKELDKYTADNFWTLEGNNESPYLLEKDDMLKVAKYFYELGLKAKGE